MYNPVAAQGAKESIHVLSLMARAPVHQGPAWDVWLSDSFLIQAVCAVVGYSPVQSTSIPWLLEVQPTGSRGSVYFSPDVLLRQCD